MNELYLSEINIYPIKSLGGFRVQKAQIEERGLQYDRRWMLVDEECIFITQRKYFELSQLQVNIAEGRLTVSHKTDLDQHISFDLNEQTGENIIVKIWDDVAVGLEVSKQVSDWFSNFMKMKVKLVKMPLDEKRLVDPKYALNEEIVSFADGYPCLIIGQSSLNALNKKLEEKILMDRFRPNFVFTGGEPHIEDRFGTFNLGEITFTAVKPCARCVLITINQQTGIKSKEPLKTLATYRTINKKIMFGQNLVHKGSGEISVGDELNIVSWKEGN
ncbi:MOSC domain-containing protein [Pedobacter fastidiosus]|uniref:MOSC domain-containing protein n=1 Tax=Pedobacter fastidiosus TaxID=2765361 RepID=A0ABR7KXK3_9SPHI|nr:MOSC N-terminal beta barrel domain-containing protein [Pedobacter fastidiosus]MBC6112848.1 MOSC domain-containing protein [Pedobacter fastidiosus]